MGLKNFFIKLIARKAGKKIGLEEGPMTDKKPWYKSKGVLSALVIILITLYEGIDSQLGPQIGFNLPDIPNVVYTVLGALGLWGRVGAKKEIG